MNISWDSLDSHLLINPAYPQEEQERFQKALSAGLDWPGHLWVSTSGSSSQKWVGLSKLSLLASAEAVNWHLESHDRDVWVNPLPFFHVGGLGIWARAYLSGAVVHDFKKDFPGRWQPETFHRYLSEVKGTLTALVPAQLHDLIMLGLRPPPSLRAVIIGGGGVHSILYSKAAALGWPVLPSYGLTECSSQVATAPLDGWRNPGLPPLKILSHLRGRMEEEHLSFSGTSLLTAYAFIEGEKAVFADPKRDGWFKTEDRGNMENGYLEIWGRADAVVKIGGESVDLSRLENHLEALKLEGGYPFDAYLLSMPDERLGNSIHLASNSRSELALIPLVNAYDSSVLPFERIRNIHLLPELPRSPLGKILRHELISKIVKIHS